MTATSLLICLVSIFALAKASPARPDLVLHERSEAVPSGFVQNGPASASTSLTLRMALVSNNMPGLEKALYDVSTPGSALYGQHLSKEEVNTYFSDLRFGK
jgi:tripeptidyl-peptidase-1